MVDYQWDGQGFRCQRRCSRLAATGPRTCGAVAKGGWCMRASGGLIWCGFGGTCHTWRRTGGQDWCASGAVAIAVSLTGSAVYQVCRRGCRGGGARVIVPFFTAHAADRPRHCLQDQTIQLQAHRMRSQQRLLHGPASKCALALDFLNPDRAPRLLQLPGSTDARAMLLQLWPLPLPAGGCDRPS